jgi:hypothetical protein
LKSVEGSRYRYRGERVRERRKKDEAGPAS